LQFSSLNQPAVTLRFYAGLCLCAIALLPIGDVFDAQGQPKDMIYLSAAPTKDSESCTVLVNKRLRQQLARYAAQYPKHVLKPAALLLFSAKGGGFSAQTVVNLFQRLYRFAAIDGASSHSGRRQFVTELADKGINARIVQALARHKHLSTTQRYIDINDNKLRATLELLN
jgi:integrase/recombinase XerD